jgi:peptidyl-tRNA hydrolase, PTH1 family
MLLIVGLGNHGSKYELTRHNAGFICIQALKETFVGKINTKLKFHGELITIYPEDLLPEASHLYSLTQHHKQVILFQPTTYMNLSGKAVLEISNFYKIAPEQIIVIHDDLDLPLGKLRVKKGGGSGGHNGLESIDRLIGNNYTRLRVGIGHPGNKDLVSSYVLCKFSKKELEILEILLEKILENFGLLLANNNAQFMNNCILEQIK